MENEFDILARAADAFEHFDKIKHEMRKVEEELKDLCKEYSIAMRLWGYRPEMLRHAVEARMGRKRAI
jgi:hypothetical protein